MLYLVRKNANNKIQKKTNMDSTDGFPFPIDHKMAGAAGIQFASVGLCMFVPKASYK